MVSLTYIDAYKEAKASLGNSSEARIIFEDVLKIPFEDILKNGDSVLDDNKKEKLSEIIAKRKEGYPLQYTLGTWEFYGYEFFVGEGVLIPRPETEILVETALLKVRDEEYPKVLDLCSGTGCIAITMKEKRPDAFVYAAEKYDEAFEYLKKNNDKYDDCVNICKTDIFDEEYIKSLPMLHIVVANPPYINEKDMKNLQKEVTFEPKTALEAEDNGRYFYKKIAEAYKDKILKSGYLAFEVGIGQAEDVKNILLENGYRDIDIVKDLEGIDRVVCAHR